MDNRIDAIYGRQSIDKKDSISIESQFEFCRYELKGGEGREYKDKGYSGKNIERPDFQRLLQDIKLGLIKRVIVYKLDRISRSIVDFAKLMELFKQYNVEFVSCTEKFDTSTPMGRAMLNICIVFAQLERESIQMRVQDAFYSRCTKGYYMRGRTPYGFDTEPIVMDGIKTKKLVENAEMDFAELMYQMYAEPSSSYGEDVELCPLAEDVRVVRVPRDVMASVSQMDAPQGAIFLCRLPERKPGTILPGTLLLDGIQDPGNLGTVIRTADACGADAVFLSKGSVDLYNPKVLRATMGSLFHVPVFQNIDLHALSEKMQAKQIPLYAAHLKGDRYPYALPLQDACAFLIGNEARGLSEDAAALCDAWVKIPMPGQAESLNASVAAGVLLYEVVRQRLPK